MPGSYVLVYYEVLMEEDLKTVNERLDELEERLKKLEKWTHEPFDFTDLIKRLETLERAHPGLYQKRDNPDSDYDMDRYSAR